MGLFSFIKNVGAKIFKGNDNTEKINDLKQYIHQLELKVNNLDIQLEKETATVTGEAENQPTKEKVLIAIGNVEGVGEVEDKMTVAPQPEPEPEARFYTVKSGDYLSKISKEVYGDANKYMVIFEANKPMLKDPDLIYPGQVLRIPELS